MAIKAIQGNGFRKEKEKFINKNRENKEGTGEKNNKFKREGKSLFKKECWQCGGQGHFRSECPTLINEGNAD